MARIPPLERGVGADRLARWHAMGGRYMVSLVVAHALLIIWGYAVTAHTDVVSADRDAADQLPGRADGDGRRPAARRRRRRLGPRGARRRMRYETWYYLHLYTYLAIALAFSHQFATGADFIDNLAARVAWSALYLVVAALSSGTGSSPRSGRRCGTGCGSAGVRRGGAGVVSVYISGRHLDELRAEPGPVLPLAVPRPAACGGRRTRTRCPRRRAPDLLRITVKDARRPQRARCAGCGPAPGCSPRARTARSPPRRAGAARCC